MSKIKNLSITNHINSNFRTFAIYTLENRGIPNFYDGLTNVQRIILLNTPLKTTKTLSVVGNCFSAGYHHGDCLEYNTEINLADGSKISIGDWCDNYPDAKLLVDCVDKNGNKQISFGHSPRVGQITDEMYEIELDNGEIIRCTENHPFLVNGKWIQAKDLIENTELKSF